MKVSKEKAIEMIQGMEINIGNLRRDVEAIGDDEEFDLSAIIVTCNERTGRMGTSIVGSNAEIISDLRHACRKEFSLKMLFMELGMALTRGLMMDQAKIETPEEYAEAEAMAEAAAQED